ncbi:MAG TPA: acyltransferase [Kaistella sp.]|nr:acyltransferase [Kaistella sp.]
MRLNNLQILRGISALLVCCFHFRGDLNFGAQKWGDLLFGKGSIGVPIFFVISGFIMVYTTTKLKGEHSAKNVISFLKKRVIRIIPLYYLLTFAWMILGGSFLLYFKAEGLQRVISSLLFLPQKDQFPVLFLGWSLNYEMLFYLIFAVSLFFKTKRYLFLILFFLTAMVLGKWYHFESSYLNMVTDFKNIYFIIGVLFGLYLSKIRLDNKILQIISILFIVLFAAFFFNFFNFENQFITVVSVSLFVLAFLIFDFFLKVKSSKFLVMLGDISYSIYLSHPFVEIIFKRIHVESPLMLILLFVLKLVVVIIISKILYEILEKRFTNYLKKELLPKY